MGNLPKHRVTMAHPFLNTGVDYDGPYQIRSSKNRSQKSYKGYMLYLFAWQRRRFYSRRGKCENIFSGNGTNFVGASRKLNKDLQKVLNGNTKTISILENEQMHWHFIHPAAPHFGDIWGAGVKSVKYHLKGIIGDNNLA